MNYKSFILSFVGIIAVLISSCKKEEEVISTTGISLDQTSLELTVDSSTMLVATLEPIGASGTIEWSSSNPSVVAVSNGVLNGKSTYPDCQTS